MRLVPWKAAEGVLWPDLLSAWSCDYASTSQDCRKAKPDGYLRVSQNCPFFVMNGAECASAGARNPRP